MFGRQPAPAEHPLDDATYFEARKLIYSGRNPDHLTEPHRKYFSTRIANEMKLYALCVLVEQGRKQEVEELVINLAKTYTSV